MPSLTVSLSMTTSTSVVVSVVFFFKAPSAFLSPGVIPDKKKGFVWLIHSVVMQNLEESRGIFIGFPFYSPLFFLKNLISA